MREPEDPPAGRDGSGGHEIPAGLLHEMRTPLSHIIGYSELLMEQAEEEGRPETLAHLEKVRAAGHRLLALIDEHFRPVGTPGATD